MPTTNDIEQSVICYLEAYEQALLEFTCSLIACPSMTPPGDERAMVERVISELSKFGLSDVKIEALAPTRPNLICRLHGEPGKPVLMYSGHLDTKPVGNLEDWKTDPFRGTIQGGNLYGLGVGDMKASVAAMVYAAAALQNSNAPLAGDLLLCFTADEEGGSTYGADYLARHNLVWADYAVLGEPCGVKREWENICVVSRGIACCRVKVYGTQMHSSISDQVPSINASEKMAKVLARVKSELEVRFDAHPFCAGGVTINPGVCVNGGVTWGVYPGYAEFGIDIRVVPGMTRQGLEEDLLAFLNKLKREDPDLNAELAFEPSPRDWLDATEISPSLPVVQAMQQATKKVFGQSLPLGAFPAVTDAARFQKAGGIPTIPALGPGCLTRAHSPNEFIAVDSILKAAKVYALGALALLN